MRSLPFEQLSEDFGLLNRIVQRVVSVRALGVELESNQAQPARLSNWQAILDGDRCLDIEATRVIER
jgi:hypothetical protein